MPTLEQQRTIRDQLIEGMTALGISEVPCFEVKLTDGSTIQILSETNPALNRPASDIVPGSMKFKSSAEAG